MPKAFNKAICFTDIHFGKKANDRIHNQDCMEFVQWVVALGKKHHCETCIFLGDWHDNRSSIQVGTMNLSLSAMELLNDRFKTVYFIVGNHDLFYRERRDVSSVVFGKHLANVVMIDQPTMVNDVMFCPWLVGDEWEQLKDKKADYLFGHFELPSFMLNAKVKMEDHGGLQTKHLSGFGKVFSGHFHQRQQANNIYYIGNAFPHNFSDSGDTARGCMILEYGNEPQFIDWEDCPVYHNITLSELVENPAKYLGAKSTVRATIDLSLSFEEAQLLREGLQDEYGCRRVDLVQNRTLLEETTMLTDVGSFHTVEQIVIAGIEELEDTPSIQKNILLAIFSELVN